jgi:hypothetical protein
MIQALRVSFGVVALFLAWVAGCARPAAERPAVAEPAATPAVAGSGVAAVPPGFRRMQVGRYVALCEPADAAWVRLALARVAPVAPPTVAAQARAWVAGDGPALARRLAQDLALPDDSRVTADFVARELLPSLRQMEAGGPPPSLLVVAAEPQARPAKETGPPGGGAGTGGWPAAEPVVCHYDASQGPADRARFLTEQVDGWNALAWRHLNDAVLPRVTNLFHGFLAEQLAPLAPGKDQRWLGEGTAGYLATRHAALLFGVDEKRLLEQAVLDPEGARFRARAVDLTEAVDASSLPEIVAWHHAAARGRKATLVVAVMAHDAGHASIPNLLAALRARRPSDAAAMVELIREVTKFDAAKYLPPS